MKDAITYTRFVITDHLNNIIQTYVRKINRENSDLDDRTAINDLFVIANVGTSARRIVKCNKDTLNTPYEAGLTAGIDTGTAIISMGSVNYGVILFLPDGGVSTAPFVCKKTNGAWGDWVRIATDVDLYGVGTTIKSGDDLNNYSTPGHYYSSSATISGTLAHCPYTTAGFSLDVSYNASSAYLWQEIRSRGNGAIHFRTCSDGTWNPWQKVTTTTVN